MPAAPEQLMHSRGELCERKGPMCGQPTNCQFGDLGAKGVGLERCSEPPDHSEVVTGRAGAGEDAVAQPQQSDAA